MRTAECPLVTASVIGAVAVERQSIIAEFDDIWRQTVESGRPLGAQRLGRADHYVAVVKSLLVPVDGQESGSRAGVGKHRVLAAYGGREVDVPLFPERPLATGSTLAQEPVGRQDAVDDRHERRVGGVHGVEPVLELTPADRVRREPPCTYDLVYTINNHNSSTTRYLYTARCASIAVNLNVEVWTLEMVSFPIDRQSPLKGAFF